MANAAMQSEQTLALQYLQTNPVCITGETTFITNHQYATPLNSPSYPTANPTQSNKINTDSVLGIDVSSTTAPSSYDAALILQGSFAHLEGYTNEYNQVVTGDARDIVVLCPTAAIFTAFQTASTSQLIANNSNVLVNNPMYALIKEAGYSVKVAYVPNLDITYFGASDVLIMRSDNINKGLIEGSDPEVYEYFGYGNPIANFYQSAIFDMNKCLAFGCGRWESLLQVTLTTSS
jgi:hypothetical protein